MLRKLIIPLVSIGLLIVLLTALLRPTKEKESPLIGKIAPNFTLKTFEGAVVSLNQFKGEPVVINFWASWCIPCRDEAPVLNRLASDHPEIVVFGINFQDNQTDANEFRKEFKLVFPVLNGNTDSVAVSYGVTGVPETFFIDKTGKITSRHAGPVDQTIIEQKIKEIL